MVSWSPTANHEPGRGAGRVVAESLFNGDDTRHQEHRTKSARGCLAARKPRTRTNHCRETPSIPHCASWVTPTARRHEYSRRRPNSDAAASRSWAPRSARHKPERAFMAAMSEDSQLMARPWYFDSSQSANLHVVSWSVFERFKPAAARRSRRNLDRIMFSDPL